jgi:surface polysaccharide O-acyltransferase-like enzyme
MKRLLLPLVFWNVAYAGNALLMARANHIHLWSDSKGPGDWLLQEATKMLVGPGTSAHLWFMYPLVAVTVVLWLIRVGPRVITEERLRLPFALLVGLLVLPYGVAPAFKVGVDWAGFGWALGCAIFGYVYLSAPPPRLRLSLALYLGATLAMLVTARMFGFERWPMSVAGPMVAAQAIGVIGIVRSVRIPVSWRPRVIALAGCTYGVYFFHMAVLRALRLFLIDKGLPETTVLVATSVGTVALAYAAVYTWHRSRALRALMA